MVAKDVFNIAMGLLQEDDTADFEVFAIPMLNVILGETYNVNNSLRRYANKEMLTDIPQIVSLNDELIYESYLLINAFPYGLASKIMLDDTDLNKMAFLHNQYAAAVTACSRAIAGNIENVYGGDIFESSIN